MAQLPKQQTKTARLIYYSGANFCYRRGMYGFDFGVAVILPACCKQVVDTAPIPRN